ncbi:hypothetical protein BD410DRAFT_796680 [Rickenella mellea]|uniref:Extracellular membrane protein CFEM domain-containing protein n=1 Tax=Rickenella mellea TaxID=50990 RepID=A0A4Y7PJ37_9AGAM|nr:hypothetical protein BD410DRAFT_796680 [Rickenella mellea]
MFRSIAALAFFLVFAGRALALNIQFGGTIGNITASQLLAIPQGPYSPACADTCNTANSTIQACGDTNDQCLCTPTVGTQLQECEQCLFAQLIDMNMRAPDPRVGSNPGLGAFTAACNVSTVKLALVTPPNWVGPTTEILSLPATIVTVGFGAILGFSIIFLLSNIS